MSTCDTSHHNNSPSCHSKQSFDVLLWGSMAIVAVLYALALVASDALPTWLHTAAEATENLVNTMWWGMALGVVMLSLLTRIPREFVISVLGAGGGFTGIVRATAAGVLLDLCNHGILMVGAKLYERGASLGQVMAFLIASPWNSFSLTLILVALIGLKWTVVFILASVLIAVISGCLFDALVRRGVLPTNPNTLALPENFDFWSQARAGLRDTRFDKRFVFTMFVDGIKESRMVMRWVLFGIVLAVALKSFVPADIFSSYFGPSLLGLGATIVAATIIEVCSEGSTPIAADLLTRANAPGNSFAFLMTGASTDYTEIMVMKERTASWKAALFLPLLTVPQIVLVALVMNAGG
ncbi:permease [Spongiibacter marinus]|uniref:permease n=1 Tax=Spongiibacter marinus TaxID=354246 RepID=UPI0035BE33C1